MELIIDNPPKLKYFGNFIINTEPDDYSWANSISTGMVRNVLLRSDGSILLTGIANRPGEARFETRIVSLSASGQLEQTFADQGVLRFSYAGSAMDVVQGSYEDKDGRILVLGSIYLEGDPNVAVTPDSPSNGFALSLGRINRDGTFDQSFGLNGKVLLGLSELGADYFLPTEVSFTVDGKILVLCSMGMMSGVSITNEHAAVIRLNHDGSLDNSFGSKGYIEIPASYGLAKDISLGSNGEISVATESITGNMYLGPANFNIHDFKINSSGQTISEPISSELNIRVNGGYTAIRAYDTNESNQTLIIADTGTIWLARLVNQDGSSDKNFNGGNDLLLPLPIGNDQILGDEIIRLPGGAYLISGHITQFDSQTNFQSAVYNFVLKVTATGLIDQTFGNNGIFETTTSQHLEKILVLPDGGILLVGASDIEIVRGAQTDLYGSFSVTKLSADGHLDYSFGGESGVTPLMMVFENSAQYQQLSPFVSAFDQDIQAASASANYSGYKLEISRQSGSNLDDGFGGVGGLVFSAAGQAILDGVDVGDVTSLTGTLSITFNENASQLVLNRVLSHIGYKYLSHSPPTDATIVSAKFPGSQSGQLSDYSLINLLWQLHEPVVQGQVGAALSAQTVSGLLLQTADDPATGTVEIAGAAMSGQSLTLVSHLVDPDGAVVIKNIQWFADGEWIWGQGNGTDKLLLSDNEVGKHITVSFQSFDSLGNWGGNFSSSVAGTVLVSDKALNLLAYSWNTHTLLSGVALSGEGHSAATANSGAASFTAITGTSLALSASLAVPSAETSAVNQAVNLQDAIAILKMIVGLDVNGAGKALSPYQAYAADYDGNGKVELSDAIGVLKHVVGLDAPTPKWLFFNEIDQTVPGKANLLPGTVPSLSVDLSAAGNIHVGLVGVLRGDVDGSYAGAAGALDLDTDTTHADYFTLLLAAHKELSPSQFGVYPQL